MSGRFAHPRAALACGAGERARTLQEAAIECAIVFDEVRRRRCFGEIDDTFLPLLEAASERLDALDVFLVALDPVVHGEAFAEAARLQYELTLAQAALPAAPRQRSAAIGVNRL